MTSITTRFFANTLGMATKAEVILPDRPDKNRPVPTLYLLHGLSDDETIWMRRTAIELYLSNYYLAVVMPCGDRSFYSNMQSGSRYFDYITDELPAIMQSYFPLSEKREDRFIAGLSMGGYGSFKSAFNFPDRYSAVAGLSSVCDINWVKHYPELCDAIYGKDFIPDLPNDLFKAAEKIAALPPEKRPRIFQYCGVEDMLFQDNVKFREHMKALGIDFHWEDGPGGHTWVNWNERIKNVLQWLPLSENVQKTDSIGV